VAREAPFIIKETTKDYQEIAIQGTLTYRVAEPIRAAARLDFTVEPSTGAYRTEDPARLVERIVNATQARTRGVIRTWTLEETLDRAQILAETVTEKLRGEQALADLGVVVEGVYVNGIRAQPDVQKALEARYRETVNRRADQAIFERRAAALEQERVLKEKEMETNIEVENRRKELVARQVENNLKEARGEAEAEEMRLAPLVKVPTEVLLALAVRQWASNPTPIGQLNITPDMLTQMASWMGGSRSDGGSK
jgi:regulator of protease activity HflC (stomatin/prohibitin superfamily)